MEAGDIKAMRDAMKETQSVIAKCLEILNKIPDSCGYGGFIEDVGDELCYLRDEHVDAALNKPPRVCDVMAAEECKRIFAKEITTNLPPEATDNDRTIATLTANGVIDTLYATAQAGGYDGSK